VHDVETAAAEGEREARADADGDAHAAPAGDRDRRSEGDELRVLEVPEQCSAAGREVAGPVRRRKDDDHVAPAPQLARESVHVLVHVVRLRPGERRDERYPHVARV
jgi:hypothetical protein